MTAAITLDSAVTALLQRAGTGLLFELAAPKGANRPQYHHWQGYARALRDLQRGAGHKLAAKDAELGGYQSPAFLRAAAGCLGVDLYDLTRAEIEQRLAQAGIQLTTHAVATPDAATAHVVEDIAIAAVDLHDKHTVARVDLDDGASRHGTTVAQGGAA